ncbi:hypothetical protein ELH84_32545 [Rhizobium ruizarguesonis]|nr:hypothetical protein ELH84_32545 [Rhizobium ruizarguesonis]
MTRPAASRQITARTRRVGGLPLRPLTLWRERKDFAGDHTWSCHACWQRRSRQRNASHTKMEDPETRRFGSVLGFQSGNR